EPGLPRRHAAQAAVPQRPRAPRRGRVAREGVRRLALHHLGRVRGPDARLRAGPALLGRGRRRRGGPDRRQPARLGHGRDRGARGRRPLARHLPRLAGRRGRLPAGVLRRQGGAGRGRGAGGQAPQHLRPRADAPPHRLLRPARDAEILRPAAPAGVRVGEARRGGARGGACRLGPVGRCDPGRGSGDSLHHLRHHGAAQARHAEVLRADPALRELPQGRPAGAGGRLRFGAAAALDHGAALCPGLGADRPDAGELRRRARDDDGRFPGDRPELRALRAPRVGDACGRRARPRHGRLAAQKRHVRARDADGPRRAEARPPLPLGGRAAVPRLARPPRLHSAELRRHRRRGARPRDLPLLPGHGRAAAPALRPDGDARRLHRASAGRREPGHGGRRLQRPDRDPHRQPRPERPGRDRDAAPQHVLRLLQAAGEQRPARRLAPHRRRRLLRQGRAPGGDRPREGPRHHRRRRPLLAAVHREQAEVQPLRGGSGGAGGQASALGRHGLHPLPHRRQMGGAAAHFLHHLHRPLGQARGAGAAARRGGEGERHPAGAAAHPRLPAALQGAGRRRR
ncbi:MAG: Long-chain-fatty-acid--CoA ligase, partial [uncultured Acetobacteraceae bacterium]